MALRRMLFGFSVLMLLGLGVWHMGSSSRQAAVKASGNTRPKRVVPELLESFAFDYKSSSYMNPQLGIAGKKSGFTMDCTATGKLHLQVSLQHTLSLFFHFDSLVCSGAELLQNPLLRREFSITRDALLSEEARQRAGEDPTIAVARTLFTQLDLGLRPSWSETRTSWQQKESRPEGIASVAVEAKKAGELWHWTKSFQGSVGQAPSSPIGLQQTLEYRVDGKSRDSETVELGLLELTGLEKTESLQNTSLIARSEIQTRLVRDKRIHGEQLEYVQPQNLSLNWERQDLTVEERRRLLQRWQEFRDGPGQTDAFGQSEANQSVYLELKQSIRREPELARELAQDLAELNPQSSGFATLAGALVYSGERLALDATLEQVEKHQQIAEWQERMLPLIGLAPQPTDRSWAYLESMSKKSADKGLASAAELGLATHLKRGFQNQSTEDFRQRLAQRLQAARSDQERLHLLDLVGNAGMEEVLPQLEAWFANGSPALRLRIAEALRHMPSLRAELLLLSMLQNQGADLAITALGSLRERELQPSSLPILLDVLRDSGDDRIRSLVLENLYMARHLDRDLLTQVRRIRQSLNLSAAMAQTWQQVEADWIDPQGS